MQGRLGMKKAENMLLESEKKCWIFLRGGAIMSDGCFLGRISGKKTI